MLKSVKLTVKLPLIIVAIALTSNMILGYTSYQSSQTVVQQKADQNLQTIADLKAEELKYYFLGIKEDLLFMSSAKSTAKAIQEFDQAWQQIEGDKTKALQKAYIDDNPNPAGQKQELLAASEQILYN